MVRLVAYDDDLAMIFANIWRDLPPETGDFVGWAAASGPTLSDHIGVFVPLWCFSGAEVERWLADSCPALAGCAVHGGARYLDVELGPGAWQGQSKGVAAKLLRRTGEIINDGEALGAGITQCRICAVSSTLFRAHFASPDACGLEAHVQASHRLCVAPRHAFSHGFLQGMRSLGFSAEVVDIRSLAYAARLCASTASSSYRRCVGEIVAFPESDEALLGHTLRFRVGESILVTAQALRDKEIGQPDVDAALPLQPRAQAEFARDAIAGASMHRRARRWKRSFRSSAALTPRSRSASAALAPW